MTYRFHEEVRALLRDLARLGNEHLALARAELRLALGQVVRGIALLVVAGGLLAGVLLFAPVVVTLVLSLWIPLWAAALLIFLLSLLGVVGAAWGGIRRLRAAKFVELRSVLREDLQWIRDLLRSSRESGPSEP
ncbi:MAG: phage holin family protein [Armatimonadota bacterium]|nr:phage holin family protein [Armatimonadota bacterium]MDR7445112.1 phage holin family protein [Armatimonadota bacterium]MDR7570613.1 phage holin family protein [Armatimonadota bacterium]MDR7614012.1 phage holin family protein [Armatimonadota bacterium]